MAYVSIETTLSYVRCKRKMVTDIELYTRLAAMEQRLSSLEQILIRLYNVVTDLANRILQAQRASIT